MFKNNNFATAKKPTDPKSDSRARELLLGGYNNTNRGVQPSHSQRGGYDKTRGTSLAGYSDPQHLNGGDITMANINVDSRGYGGGTPSQIERFDDRHVPMRSHESHGMERPGGAPEEPTRSLTCQKSPSDFCTYKNLYETLVET